MIYVHGLIDISRSLYHYESRRLDDEELRTRLCEMVTVKRRYGYRRLQEAVSGT